MDPSGIETPSEASSRDISDATRELNLDAPTIPLAAPETPTTPSLAAPNGDKCPSCGSGLATDQRYCLECGERRGEPRLPFMDGRPQHVAPAITTTPSRRLPSAGLTLIASIGVLLLAMGVGVLIGHSGTKAPAQASSPIIYGAPAATAATGATTATGATDATAATKNSTSTAKAKKKTLPPATVKLGQKGKGPGYTKGKFTGDFFGQ